MSSKPTEADARQAVLGQFIPELADRVCAAYASVTDLDGCVARIVEDDWVHRVVAALPRALPHEYPDPGGSSSTAASNESLTRIATATDDEHLVKVIAPIVLDTVTVPPIASAPRTSGSDAVATRRSRRKPLPPPSGRTTRSCFASFWRSVAESSSGSWRRSGASASAAAACPGLRVPGLSATTASRSETSNRTAGVCDASGRSTIVDSLPMAGGIALSGQVLPVGGIRERVLAAHRYDLPHAFGCTEPTPRGREARGLTSSPCSTAWPSIDGLAGLGLAARVHVARRLSSGNRPVTASVIGTRPCAAQTPRLWPELPETRSSRTFPYVCCDAPLHGHLGRSSGDAVASTVILYTSMRSGADGPLQAPTRGSALCGARRAGGDLGCPVRDGSLDLVGVSSRVARPMRNEIVMPRSPARAASPVKADGQGERDFARPLVDPSAVPGASTIAKTLNHRPDLRFYRRRQQFASERECVEHLFALYERQRALAAQAGGSSRTTRRGRTPRRR